MSQQAWDEHSRLVIEHGGESVPMRSDTLREMRSSHLPRRPKKSAFWYGAPCVLFGLLVGIAYYRGGGPEAFGGAPLSNINDANAEGDKKHSDSTGDKRSSDAKAGGSNDIDHQSSDASGPDASNADTKHGAIRKLTYPSGDVYEGTTNKYSKEGHGKLTFANGDVYEGDFRNNTMDGHGKYICAVSGSIYEGRFRNGKKEGHGTETQLNGEVYEGGFQNGQPEGHGRYTDTSGNVYDGSFHSGKKEGRGKLTNVNGDVYIGTWHNDLLDGVGKFTFANGNTYTGDFDHGHGKLTKHSTDNVNDGESMMGNRMRGAVAATVAA